MRSPALHPKEQAPMIRLAAVALALLLVMAGCAPEGGEVGEVGIPGQMLRISDSGTALPLVEKLAEAYGLKHPETEFRFEPGTSLDGAIGGVLDGTLDLAVADRPISRDEESEPLAYGPFARDAVVFVANQSGDEVEGLSTDQVRAVYRGELTDWEQLGGPAGDILVLDRDGDEPARELVLAPLMDGHPIEARTIVLDKASEMVDALKSTPGSIGYASSGLLQNEQPERVKVLSLDGAVPSPEAVARDEYPWSLTFALVYEEDASTAVRGFAEFVAGPEGRRLVEENGYVAVS